jgi:hypothetical protein
VIGAQGGGATGPAGITAGIARTYRERGLAPIPLRPRSKVPIQNDWPRLVTDERTQFPGNIGVKDGAPSSNVVDLDLDCGEARLLAPRVMPETEACFGRASAPCAHWLYRSDPAPEATMQWIGDNGMILEVRSTGGQTMFPPSVHPCGEIVEWHRDGLAAPIEQTELLRRTGILAAVSLLMQHWPAAGAHLRYPAWGAMIGCLVRCGVDVAIVEEIIGAFAGKLFKADRARMRAPAVFRRRLDEKSGRVPGFPALKAVFGERVADLCREWLPRQAALDDKAVTFADFHAYMPMHNYIFVPSRETWPGGAVDSRLPPVSVGFDDKGKEKFISASRWLDQNQPVEQMTWAPGMPMIIENRLIAIGGWIERAGVRCFNLYRPPTIVRGDASTGRWRDLLERVYPDDVGHIEQWLAHRVQYPAVKINHALVFGGPPGIGKDTILEPVKRAVGPWNFREASPQDLLQPFNDFVRSVILRISEARDLGDFDRFKFYDHMKVYIAAPPDVLRVNEKHLRQYTIINCCGVVITTNYKTDGIYLPADDRRHYVTWSELHREDFEDEYWNEVWGWYDNGGDRAVAGYLAGLDLTGFDPKAAPPKTPAFWAIVDANSNPENAELADAIDDLGKRDPITHEVTERPKVVTLEMIASRAGPKLSGYLEDSRNARQIPRRLEDCGYVAVRNPGPKDGKWKLQGSRRVIYAKRELSIREQLVAVNKYVEEYNKPLPPF